jgi:hypothetical protein
MFLLQDPQDWPHDMMTLSMQQISPRIVCATNVCCRTPNGLCAYLGQSSVIDRFWTINDSISRL